MVYIGYRQLVFCVHKSEIEKKGTQISKKVPMGTWAPKRGPIVEQWGRVGEPSAIRKASRKKTLEKFGLWPNRAGVSEDIFWSLKNQGLEMAQNGIQKCKNSLI